MPRGRRNCMKGVRRICRNIHCRKEFEPGHELATYCCLACRQSSANQRLRERIKKETREGIAAGAIKSIMDLGVEARDIIRILGELGIDCSSPRINVD